MTPETQLGLLMDPLVRRRRRTRLAWRLAAGWAVAAALAAAVWLVTGLVGRTLPGLVAVVGLAGVAAAWFLGRLPKTGEPDARVIASEIEARHPELRGLLLTAVQQHERAGDRLNVLQQRVVSEALAHGRTHDWAKSVPTARLGLAMLTQCAALVLFLVVLGQLLRAPKGNLGSRLLAQAFGVTVSPGDISLERGESLVVLARFGSEVPNEVDLILGDTPTTERRIPLTRSLSDPVFGGTVPEVGQSLSYRIEYGGKRSRDYQVTVFEHPRLERADAGLTFPSYTGQEPRRIEDTKRITAVEGTSLDLALQLNKPVTSAVLVPRDTNELRLTLTLATNQARAELTNHLMLAKGTYDLKLVDADGRTNKGITTFVFDVVPNRTPELKLAHPRGDIRPSPLEEIRFEGTVWDDFGVLAHGLAFSLVEQEPRIVELGTNVARGERRSFQTSLRLEEFGVLPDQLVSYHLWADDIGPDGKVRRTTSDLLFAEVRPFEEIFREGSGGEGESQDSQSGNSRNPTGELIKLQKQIISATFNLRRDAKGADAKFKADLETIQESQQHALEQAEGRAEAAGGPRTQELWDKVTEQMSTAIVRLKDAASGPAQLSPALASEQAAHQALLKLQARETEVTRSRSRGQGGEGGGNQRQIDELELTQSENRYETQRQAQADVTPERREQLQVLNRLQELARRQQDINQRLKELQTALQEADTEREREEVRRQLKRLQEEQQRMLADMDELEQRTQRPENQARMSEMRQRLEQTRQDMERASQATGDGSVSQAVAAGTRAQERLQSMRDELRQQNSSQFAEDLRNLRADARDIEKRQEEINRQLNAQPQSRTAPSQRRLSDDSSNAATENLTQLGQQRERLTNLVDRATRLSQAAESTEPLVSQHLYDSLRQLSQQEASTLKQAQQDLIDRGQMTQSLYERLKAAEQGEGSAKALELASELLRQGMPAEASQAGERAEAGMDILRRGVERAAESVLGDDTSALRMARDELQILSQQLEQEIRQSSAQNGASAGSSDEPRENPNAAGQNEGRQPGPGQAGNENRDLAQNDRANAGGQNGSDSQPPGSQPGPNPGQEGSGSAPDAEGQQQAGTQPGGREGQPQRQAQAQGQGQGEGQGQGQGQGEPQAGQNDAQAQAQAQAQSQNGRGRGEGQAQRAGNDARGQRGAANRSGRADGGGGNGGSGRTGGVDFEQLVGGDASRSGTGGSGPITTEGFTEWSDRLREVEEMIDVPDLRNDVATARDRARRTRQELRRDLKKPDWAVVRLEILGPLIEVGRQLDDELARRTTKNPMLPIDRDPVPNRYSELVRRYYEELGRDR
ncbi:MAG: hypothetical protein JNK85_19175 [Verrucomicrobiales bacterium]|nr:hypothetical protein [Verrucomicrobiales bacterium]